VELLNHIDGHRFVIVGTDAVAQILCKTGKKVTDME